LGDKKHLPDKRTNRRGLIKPKTAKQYVGGQSSSIQGRAVGHIKTRPVPSRRTRHGETFHREQQTSAEPHRKRDARDTEKTHDPCTKTHGEQKSGRQHPDPKQQLKSRTGRPFHISEQVPRSLRTSTQPSNTRAATLRRQRRARSHTIARASTWRSAHCTNECTERRVSHGNRDARKPADHPRQRGGGRTNDTTS